MLRFRVNLGLLLLLTPAGALADPAAQDWYEALVAPPLDEERIGTVDDLTVVRDAARFHLESGTIHFLAPTLVGDSLRCTGAVFIGRGRFECSPPTPVERHQVARYLRADSVSTEFDILVLRFSDGTFDEIAPHVTWTGESKGKPIYKKEYAEKFFYPRLVWSLLDSALRGASPGFFYAHIATEDDPRKPFFFVIDPSEREEVELLQRPVGDTAYRKETITRFQASAAAAAGRQADAEDNDVIRPVRTAVATAIGSAGSFAANCELSFRALRDSLYVVPLWLDPRLHVSSLKRPGGAPVTFLRPDEPGEGWLFVFFDPPLHAGEEAAVRCSYAGPILLHDWGGFYLMSSAGWYPDIGPPTYGARATSQFDLTFSCPKRYTVLSVGDRIEGPTTDGGNVVSRWRTKGPAGYASFQVGLFDSYRQEADADTLPVVRAYATQEGRSALSLALVASGIGVKKEPAASIAATAASAAKLYSVLFGRCESDSLSVTEIPAGHGQSFPGLIHLAWISFQSGLEEMQLQPVPGSDLSFCGHEVAHQWWGNAVRPATYHDAWLSEGFAEYSGYMFVRAATKGDETFNGLLDTARDHILRNRRRAFGRGIREEPPISLGTRSNSSMNQDDYSLLIYEKGAWVLHMLRYMLVDLHTSDESAFFGLMRDFYARYRGKKATTLDFRRSVEEHMGMDMGWFFDQWVDGTAIPTYEFSAGWSPQTDGTYKVSGMIRQSSVPDGFTAYPIVRVQFDDERYYQFRVKVSEPETRFTLAVPLKPTAVRFNDLNSVLAEVKE